MLENLITVMWVYMSSLNTNPHSQPISYIYFIRENISPRKLVTETSELRVVVATTQFNSNSETANDVGAFLPGSSRGSPH